MAAPVLGWSEVTMSVSEAAAQRKKGIEGRVRARLRGLAVLGLVNGWVRLGIG